MSISSFRIVDIEYADAMDDAPALSVVTFAINTPSGLPISHDGGKIRICLARDPSQTLAEIENAAFDKLKAVLKHLAEELAGGDLGDTLSRYPTSPPMG